MGGSVWDRGVGVGVCRIAVGWGGGRCHLLVGS